MQVVIDMPKERFEDIQRIASVQLDSNHFKTAEQIIANGTPQPKVGKWIGYNTDKEDWKRTDGSPVFMNCSECNGMVINNGSAYWNYCPNCGAKMAKMEVKE